MQCGSDMIVSAVRDSDTSCEARFAVREVSPPLGVAHVGFYLTALSLAPIPVLVFLPVQKLASRRALVNDGCLYSSTMISDSHPLTNLFRDAVFASLLAPLILDIRC